MQKRLIGAAILALASLTFAQTISYDAKLQTGNQNWGGNLGLDFTVISPITVSSLGAFDGAGNGFVGTISVAIYNQSTKAQVAGPVSLHGSTAPLTNGDRFQALPIPVTLPAGNYSIVAVGFSNSDLNGNTTLAGITASTESTGGGLISFTGSGRYDANTSLDFPTIIPSGSPTNVFLAGTFQYAAVSAPPPPQTISYDAAKQAGNQSWTGNLGLDFTVNSPTTIYSLGAFDSNGDGFVGTVHVAIYHGSTQVIAPVTFHGTTGTLINGDRFQTLVPPVVLPAGTYSVVAVGFSAADLNGNTTISGATASTENTGSGLITFTGSGRYDANTSLDFPSILGGGANNVFLAGTFQFGGIPADYFAPGTDLTAGMYSEALAVGNFGTGHQSLAVVNQGSNNVSVLLGQGTGAFTGPTNYNVGSSPHAIVAADFGNGKTDLAVANSASNNVSVLIGNGSGGFLPAVNYNAGTTPYSIAIGKFNNDANMDLVVVNDNLAITILMGNGNGTFQTGVTHFDTNIAPTSVAVADFNHDGCQDLVVANANLGTVSVLFGKCDGTFMPAVSTPKYFPRPYFITTGFFNGDAIPDVAVTDYSGKVYVLTGTGSSVTPFNAPAPLTGYAVGDIPTSIAVGDINGDGTADLLVANSLNANVSILAGNGDGTFQSAVNYSTPTMTFPVAVALGVFKESTGILDGAVANFTGPLNLLIGTEYKVSVTGGSAQITKTPTGAFTNSLVVVLTPAAAGIPVTFTAPTSGPSASFTGGTNTITVLTDGTGTAISPSFKGNGQAGSFTIKATIGFGASGDTSASAVFMETNG